jgi:hypothetical protein
MTVLCMPPFCDTTNSSKNASSTSTFPSSQPIDKFRGYLEKPREDFDFRRPARKSFALFDSTYTVPKDDYVWTGFDEHFDQTFSRAVFSRAQKIQTPQLWTEDLIQCFVLAYSRQMLAPLKADVAYTVANETRYKQRGPIPLHHNGLFSGLSDIVVPLPAGGFGALYLELKRDRAVQSQVSRKQVLFGQAISAVGNLYVIAWGVQDAIRVLDAYIRMWIDTRAPPADFHHLVPDNLRHVKPTNDAAFNLWLDETETHHKKRKLEVVDTTSNKK